MVVRRRLRELKLRQARTKFSVKVMRVQKEPPPLKLSKPPLEAAVVLKVFDQQPLDNVPTRQVKRQLPLLRRLARPP